MADVQRAGDGFWHGPTTEDLVAEGLDLHITDSDYVRFGSLLSNGDAYMGWDGTNLVLKPGVDDTGSFIIGDGTTDFDVKVFLGDTLNYVLFDVGNSWLHVQHSTAGGDSPKGMLIDVDVLAGNGFRQGGLQILVDRAVGQDVTWDGNPDCGLKIQVNNRAANASAEGAVRGLDLSARNRGTDISWVNGAHFGARNDSGKQAQTVTALSCRIENYGNVATSIVGLDVDLSDENSNVDPHTKTGILIRNTDQSGMGAVDEVFKISHTSTNGFSYLFNFAGASGDAVESGSLTDSGAGDVACDARVPVVWNGVDYWLPLFNTAA